MKTNGETQKTKNITLHSLLVTALLIVVLSLGAAFSVHETNRYKAQALGCFQSGQEKLLKQVRKEIEAALFTDEARAIEALKGADASGSRHWFLYRDSGPVFERDDATTREVAGFSMKQLTDQWRMQGGSEVGAFLDLVFEARSESLIFAKSAHEGDGLASLVTFRVRQVPYTLGVFTRSDYILTSTGAVERILYFRIFSVAAGIALVVFAISLIHRVRRHGQREKELLKEALERTRQIEELNLRLVSKEDTVEDVSIYDGLTGVYNKVFFGNLLSRVHYERIQPVSLMIVDINGLYTLCERAGDEAGDALLKRTAALLEKFCIESDLIARTDHSEFRILMTDAEEEQAYGTMENILRQFANSETGGLTLSVGIAQMKRGTNRISPVIREAKKNLLLSKMLDPVSERYSMVAVLMEILVAFSKESVAQSNRMREMSKAFGKELGLTPAAISELALAAQLHDVGKIGVPVNILYKQAPLDSKEKELIRWHAEIGYGILRAVPCLDGVAEDVKQHREHYDGSGYPLGLKGGHIRLNARVLNILESYDVMTHERVYAATLSAEEAMEELKKGRGEQYDPHLVDRFCAFIERERGLR